MKLSATLKRFRVQRGLTQQELARLVGLSRQSLNRIENGSSIPSTVVALQLARAVGSRVEDLFELADAGGGLTATLAQPLRPTSPGASGRVVVGSVAGRWIAHRLDPRQRPRDLTVAADAVLLEARRAGQVRLRPLVDPDRLGENLLVAGCDPALGLLADRADRGVPGARNVWLEATSGASLAALQRSEVHVAGAHLFDSESGEYNVPFARRLFAGRAMVVVNVAQIEEGLALAPGNPRRIRGVAHLARKGVRLVNRDEDAGARRLLDRLLAKEGLRPSDVEGYRRTAPGHLEAAHAVAHGSADAAVVTCASALALGLEFVPLATERFDLIFPKESLGDRRLARLVDVLSSGQFRRELQSVGGYATRRSGSIVADLS